MFQLTAKEHEGLLLQFAIAKKRGGRKTPPYAFTQEGVAMLSSVLRSARAVRVNVAIMRAFVKLREAMATSKELAERIADLERRYADHDVEIKAVFEAVRELLNPPLPAKRQIGFGAGHR